MPDDSNADHLERLRKLSQQLDSAQQLSKQTTDEIARAQAVAQKVAKDVRLHDTTPARKRKRSQKKR